MEVPGIFHGSLAELARNFSVHSATPIIRAEFINTEAVRLEKLEMFKKQIADTPRSETGLIHDLKWVISELEALKMCVLTTSQRCPLYGKSWMDLVTDTPQAIPVSQR